MLTRLRLEHRLELLRYLDDRPAEGHVNVGSQVHRGEDLQGQVRVDLANELGGVADQQVGVAVEGGRDVSIGVDQGDVAAELLDLANHHDIAPDVGVQQAAVDAGR